MKNGQAGISRLFSRWINGTATRREMDEWLDKIGQVNDKDEQEMKTMLEQAWEDTPPERTVPEDKWKQVYRSVIRSGQEPPVTRTIVWWRKIAAVAAILVLVTGGMYLYRHISRPAPVTWKEITTQAGERKKIGLNDGTVIWLNAASHLKYPERFTGPGRNIHLNGEAFFEVEPDPARPFRVHSQGLTTEVLGTAFNVNAYEQEGQVHITVAHGKVQVCDSMTMLGTLEPSQQLSYGRSSRKTEIRQVNPEAFTVWRKGELVLDNLTFGEAAHVMEKWFGVTIRFENKQVKNKRFTVKFRKGETLQQVLEVLCEMNGASFQVTGTAGDKQVIIR